MNTAEERRPALQRLVEKHGGRSNPGPFGTSKINWPLPTKLPLVSIIIPTKDRVDLLKPCVESVLDRTSYAVLRSYCRQPKYRAGDRRLFR